MKIFESYLQAAIVQNAITVEIKGQNNDFARLNANTPNLTRIKIHAYLHAMLNADN